MGMTKTPEELAKEWAINWHKDCDYPDAILEQTHKATMTTFLAGYKAAQEQATDNFASITLKDILGMTIEEYLYKHSEEIAEEVLNNNPLLKKLKDE
jgi:hypothetical protein